MKKIFEYLGLISLIVFSFFITEKTAIVVQEVDDIMIKIKDEMKFYNTNGTDALINDNTIVPGLVSKKVNVDKSYKNMKEKGLYDPSFYIYDEIKPTISISDNLDKYIISGNATKSTVSLVFLVENKEIEDIQEVIGPTAVSFVISSYNFDDQIDDIITTSKLNNDIIASTSNEHNYQLLKQKLSSLNVDLNYCYGELTDYKFLNICHNDNKHSISSDNIIENQPLMNVKKNLKSGSILVFKINNEVIEELPNIITYIKSRGYKIETLSNHLSENW